jgi:hypothetical protein
MDWFKDRRRCHHTVFGSCYLDSNIVISKVFRDRPDFNDKIDYIFDQYLGEYIFISPIAIGEFFQLAIKKFKKTPEEANKLLRDFIEKYSITITCPDIDLSERLPLASHGELWEDLELRDCKHGSLKIISYYGDEIKTRKLESEVPNYSDNNYKIADITGLLSRFFIIALFEEYGPNSKGLSHLDRLTLFMARKNRPLYFITMDVGLLEAFGDFGERMWGNIVGMYMPDEFVELIKTEKRRIYGCEHENHSWEKEKDKGKTKIRIDVIEN